MATEKGTKKFTKSYNLLLQQALVMKASLANDLALFTARFPHIDADYVTEMGAAITNADTAPADNEMLGDQKQKTFALTDRMKLAADKYSYLASFLRVVYHANPRPVLNHFGIVPSRKSRVQQMKQIEKLELAYQRANSAEYKPTLLAKGFTQPEIDQLNTLSQQLNSENIAQEKSKTDRTKMAQSRIALYNTVWDVMSELHAASLLVFENDYAGRQRYLLYPENAKHPVLKEIESTVLS